MKVEVIKKIEGIKDKETGKIVNRKIKVAAYARVSTDLEEQKTSFISQQQYYTKKISKEPNWIFTEVYADEGISGTQTLKRVNFLRMIEDAKNGKIDLILTKSISRFARNTIDTLKNVRLLKEHNVGVIFEEENINTLDMSGELLLTVLSSVAQQESETISSHIKLGLRMKKERGELVGFNGCYGYKCYTRENRLEIVEDEAVNVRKIFKWYLEGSGCREISQKLYENNILNRKGTNRWSASTIYGILHNEKYMGDVEQGKTFSINPLTHKRYINKGEEDKFYIKDHHERYCFKRRL